MDLINTMNSMTECSTVEELTLVWIRNRSAWREQFSRREFKALQLHGLRLGRRLLRAERWKTA
jgi:hypothetical protein